MNKPAEMPIIKTPADAVALARKCDQVRPGAFILYWLDDAQRVVLRLEMDPDHPDLVATPPRIVMPPSVVACLVARRVTEVLARPASEDVAIATFLKRTLKQLDKRLVDYVTFTDELSMSLAAHDQP